MNLARLVPLTAALCLAGPLSGCSTATDTATVTTSAHQSAPGTSATAQVGPSGPSFDCATADGDAETLVCSDPELAKLDGRLADEYDRALHRPGADTAALQATQDGWAAGRDDCGKKPDEDAVRACVLDSYRTRIFELQTSGGAVAAPPLVSYRCPGDKAFTAQFYNDLDPQVAVLTWGADSAVTFAEPAASGAKYGRVGVEFWEHHGEVKVNFFGNEFTCRTQ